MSNARHWMLTFSLFLGVAMLGSLVLAMPNYRSAAAHHHEVAELESKVRNLDELTALASELTVMLDDAKARMQHDRRMIPESPGVADLVRRLSISSDRYNVDDQTFTTGRNSLLLKSEQSEIRASMLPITVEMEGGFDAVFAILQAAETVEQLVRIKDVKIHRQKKDAIDESSLTATVQLEAVYSSGPLQEVR